MRTLRIFGGDGTPGVTVLEAVLAGRGGVNEASILFAGGIVVSSWDPFEPEVLRENIVGIKEENLDRYNSVMNFTSFVSGRVGSAARKGRNW